jgi:hypothetical protein
LEEKKEAKERRELMIRSRQTREPPEVVMARVRASEVRSQGAIGGSSVSLTFF